MTELMQIAANNVAAIAMAGFFLWYLVRRDEQMKSALEVQEKAFREMSAESRMVISNLATSFHGLQRELAVQSELLRSMVHQSKTGKE